MGYRDNVLRFARDEANAKVHWATHEKRILQYFKSATGKDYTKSKALEISWCTYFVHWVLEQAGVRPLPALATTHNACSRFLKSKIYQGVYEYHSVVAVRKKKSSYKPQPGDMYYLPDSHNHIGFIDSVNGALIGSIDGNSGPPDSKRDPTGQFGDYDLSEGRKIGYGMIYRRPTPRTLDGPNDVYIVLPEG